MGRDGMLCAAVARSGLVAEGSDPDYLGRGRYRQFIIVKVVQPSIRTKLYLFAVYRWARRQQQ